MACCNHTSSAMLVAASIAAVGVILGASTFQDSKPSDTPLAPPTPPATPATPEIPSAPAAEAVPQDEAGMMLAWARYAETGPEQEWLSKWVGEWTATVEFYMVPGAPPTQDVGSCVFQSMYGNRFLRQDYKGTMGPDGPPFEGTGYLCYDNARACFLYIWFDSMSTGWSSGIGKGGSGSGRIDWDTTDPDILRGGTKPMRGVQTFDGKDTLVLESYEPGPNGTETLQMRITYRRKQ